MSNELDKHVVAYKGNNVYDFDNEILLTWYSKRIISLCKDKDSLLELGLGHGFTAKIFSHFFEDYTVIDGSPAVINNFKIKNPAFNFNVIESFFESFLSNRKYDVIVMGFVLEHVNDPVFVLNHYRKFLSTNGRLFISVPNAEAMNRRIGKLAGLLDDLMNLSQNDLDLGHKRFYTVDSLKNDIMNAGYKLIRLEGIYLKPLTTSQICSLNLDNKIIRALCELGIFYPELSCGLLAEVTV